MGTINVLEGALTTEKGIGFDNSPESARRPIGSSVYDGRDSYAGGTVTLRWSDSASWQTDRIIYGPLYTTRWVASNHYVNGSLYEEWRDFSTSYWLAVEFNDRLWPEVFKRDDIISGGSADDIIFGYDGQDRLYGKPGNDVINGGNGSDYLFGGDGDDTLIDTIPHNSSWQSSGYYYGGKGTDTLELDANSIDLILSRSPSTGIVTIYSKEGWDSVVYPDVEFIKLKDKTFTTSEITYLGQEAFEIGSAKAKPVYEFYNAKSDAYFYTSDFNERNTIIANSHEAYSEIIYVQKARNSSADGFDTSESIFVEYSEGGLQYFYQGSSYNAASTSSTLTRAIHRFYNTDTGHHLWSIDPAEIELIKSKWDSGEWSYKYEGTSYLVYSADPDKSDASIGEEVYRLYNSASGRHFYTADSEEVTEFQLTGQWTLEGVAFWGE